MRYDDRIPELTPAAWCACVRRQTENRCAEYERLTSRFTVPVASAPVPDGCRPCMKCGEARPAGEFGLTSRGNPRSVCRACANARFRELRRRRLGSRPVPPHLRVRWEPVVAAWNAGETLWTLAKVNGVSRSFIRRRLQSLGIYVCRRASARGCAA